MRSSFSPELEKRIEQERPDLGLEEYRPLYFKFHPWSRLSLSRRTSSSMAVWTCSSCGLRPSVCSMP
jgi:hypothetical protein